MKQINEVTYFNEDDGTWGFYGCEKHYETQSDAYEEYKKHVS